MTTTRDNNNNSSSNTNNNNNNNSIFNENNRINCGGLSDSGFSSAPEMNIDSIFFYEDNCSSQDILPDLFKTQSDRDNVSMDTTSDEIPQSTLTIPKHSKRHKDSKFTQIQVNVGIDEDLKMVSCWKSS
jgi:hypothetical protein